MVRHIVNGEVRDKEQIHKLASKYGPPQISLWRTAFLL